MDVGIVTDEQYVYVNRGFTGNPDERENYLESGTVFEPLNNEVHLKILVDKTSIEVFVDDGVIAFSNQVFPDLEDQGITLFSEGNTAIFEKISIKQLPAIYSE